MPCEWTLSVMSEYPDEVAIVRSMLSILRTNLTDQWQLVESPHADLLVMGAGAESALRPRNTQVVGRLLSPGERPENAVLTLERPVRAMPFMEFLNMASMRLKARNEAASLSPAANAKCSPAQSLGQTLAALRKSGTFKRPMALLDASGERLATINTNRGEIVCHRQDGDIVHLLEQGFEQAQALTARDWEAACLTAKPGRLDRICWQLGTRLAETEGLGSWLQNMAGFRLIGWPDFGAIGNDRAGIKLSANLTQRAHTPESAAVATAVAIEQVYGFLNASSLCGLLVESPCVAAQQTPAIRRPEQASVISRLRGKLGL